MAERKTFEWPNEAGVGLYPRGAATRLSEALADSPVVLVHGPRQSGKTTLARVVGKPRGYSYLNFDDQVTQMAVSQDPVSFVADLPDRVILDEVQRVPQVFTAIKTAVDRDRSPGRFILTGSANVLMISGLADSLAGRMEILNLYPLAQCELERRQPNFLDHLFHGGFKVRPSERMGNKLIERIVAGGYPAALARSIGRRRSVWYRDYVKAILQRDARDLARVGALDALPRLMGLAAAQTAHMQNVAELAAPFQQSRPTIGGYVALLEHLFLLERIQPWHSNRLKRLVRTPKLHLIDTGVGAALLGMDAQALAANRPLFGQLLETFVMQELRRHASWREDTIVFHHFRDRDGAEVDIVIERGANELAGVEVKAGSTVTLADFRGLRKLRETVGERFAAGVVLYDGETTAGFGGDLYAVPIRYLWEPC